MKLHTIVAVDDAEMQWRRDVLNGKKMCVYIYILLMQTFMQKVL